MKRWSKRMAAFPRRLAQNAPCKTTRTRPPGETAVSLPNKVIRRSRPYQILHNWHLLNTPTPWRLGRQAANLPDRGWSGRGGSKSRPCPSLNMCPAQAAPRYRLVRPIIDAVRGRDNPAPSHIFPRPHPANESLAVLWSTGIYWKRAAYGEATARFLIQQPAITAGES